MSEIIDFVFSSSQRNRIGFSASSVYWTSKGKDKRFLQKQVWLKLLLFWSNNAILQLVILCWNKTLVSPWESILLLFGQIFFSIPSNRSLFNLLFLLVLQEHIIFILSVDSLMTCVLSMTEEFLSSYKDIYPPKLELKIEHLGGHATFLDLDITIKDDILSINSLIKGTLFLFSLFVCQSLE